MKPTTLADSDAVAAHAAQLVTRCARTAIDARGVAHVALAGGSIMERFHGALAQADLDWSVVHLWESDERAVAPNDDESNFKMINATLLEHIETPAGNVHRPRGEDGAPAAADAYEADLRAALGDDTELDVVLCGMGPDGHTCSLFPDHPAVLEADRLVAAVHDAPKPPPERITFTLPLLFRARSLLLLATGAEKAEALAAVLAGPDPNVPASMLRLGRLEVVADEAAAPSG